MAIFGVGRDEGLEMVRGVTGQEIMKEIEVGQAPGIQLVVRERRQPRERLELRVHLAPAELQSKQVDQLTMSFDQPWGTRECPAEGGLGFPRVVPLALDAPREKQGLARGRIVLGDLAEHRQRRFQTPPGDGDLGLQTAVEAGR